MKVKKKVWIGSIIGIIICGGIFAYYKKNYNYRVEPESLYECLLCNSYWPENRPSAPLERYVYTSNRCEYVYETSPTLGADIITRPAHNNWQEEARKNFKSPRSFYDIERCSENIKNQKLKNMVEFFSAIHNDALKKCLEDGNEKIEIVKNSKQLEEQILTNMQMCLNNHKNEILKDVLSKTGNRRKPKDWMLFSSILHNDTFDKCLGDENEKIEIAKDFEQLGEQVLANMQVCINNHKNEILKDVLSKTVYRGELKDMMQFFSDLQNDTLDKCLGDENEKIEITKDFEQLEEQVLANMQVCINNHKNVILKDFLRRIGNSERDFVSSGKMSRAASLILPVYNDTLDECLQNENKKTTNVKSLKQLEEQFLTSMQICINRHKNEIIKNTLYGQTYSRHMNPTLRNLMQFFSFVHNDTLDKCLWDENEKIDITENFGYLWEPVSMNVITCINRHKNEVLGGGLYEYILRSPINLTPEQENVIKFFSTVHNDTLDKCLWDENEKMENVRNLSQFGKQVSTNMLICINSHKNEVLKEINELKENEQMKEVANNIENILGE